ncbi:hypothetical protein PAHAL_6G203800 [Panicum hallii]|uniref:Uncharacterized protein n=1 Tax=Panicum hallii TaxID=206008 RepID=A0A2T8IGZ8_9POAL|nr:hypothetical protein PAHAL_6G203800 [Panicum hallii]
MACRRPSPCGAAISIPMQRLLRVRHGEAAGPGLREPQRQLTLPPATRPRPQTHGSTPSLHPEPRSRPVAHLHPKLHLETAVRRRPCAPLLDLCGRSGSDLCPPTNSLVLARAASATRTTSRPLVAGAPSSQVSSSICCTHLGCSSLGGNGAATTMGQAAIRGQNSHRANEIFRFRIISPSMTLAICCRFRISNMFFRDS